VSDAFGVLGFSPRPDVSPESLHEAYLSRAGAAHPDNPASEPGALAALNAARAVLASEPQRLRLLLALFWPAFVASAGEPADWQLFAEVGEVSRSAAAAVNLRSTATSPLTRALAQGDIAHALCQVKDMNEKCCALRLTLAGRLTRLDEQWPACDPQQIHDLAEAYTFWNRWNETLREAQVRLDGG